MVFTPDRLLSWSSGSRRFDAGVQIEVGDKTASAASIMSLLALGASPGNTARITSDGPDAEEAMNAVVAVLTEGG